MRLGKYVTTKPLAEGAFISGWILLFFIVIIPLCAIYFFPKNDLLNDLIMHPSYNQSNYQYLISLARKYPHNMSIRLALIFQKVFLKRTHVDLTQDINWLQELSINQLTEQNLFKYYEILEQLYFQRDELTLTQNVWVVAELKAVIPKINYQTLLPAQQLRLAMGAIQMQMGEYGFAVIDYYLANNPEQDEQFYVKLARLALGYGFYQQSADYYFKAEQMSASYMKRKEFYIAGLKSLQSGNLLQKAMIAAEQHINGLADDQDVLVFLTRLALAANKPQLANNYITTALKIKVSSEDNI